MYLLDVDRVKDVIPIFEDLATSDTLNVKSGKSVEEFELELCQLISKFP